MRICLRPRQIIRIGLVMTVIFMVVGGSGALRAEQMSDKDITLAVGG
jgi:hypothetical protein